jgi:hypothetical protein
VLFLCIASHLLLRIDCSANATLAEVTEVALCIQSASAACRLLCATKACDHLHSCANMRGWSPFQTGFDEQSVHSAFALVKLLRAVTQAGV